VNLILNLDGHRETTPLDEIMKKLVKVAQEKGVTDDIAGIVIRL
jgi:hypothetical protein